MASAGEYGGGLLLEALRGGAVVCEPVGGACCESKDGPLVLEFEFAFGFSPDGSESNLTLDIRSAACSVESARLSSLAVTSLLLPRDAGLLSWSPSILLIPNAQRSRWEVDPKEELGDGRGCEPVMKTDSERGVWLPPRPREGGTPTRRVGGGV